MSKKILFIIVFISISTFLFTFSVKAETNNSFNIDYNDFNKLFYSVDNLNDYEYSRYQSAFEYYKINPETDYYVFLYYAKSYIMCVKWDKNITLTVPLSITLEKNYNVSSTLFNLYLLTSTSIDYTTSVYYLTEEKTGNATGYITSYGLNGRGVKLNQVKNGTDTFVYDTTSPFYMSILDTNCDILFNNYYYDGNPSSGAYDKLFVNDNENDICLKEFLVGDVLINKDFDFDWNQKTYTYENLIDTTELNRVEFSFKIPDENTFSFDLELLTQFSDIYLSKPYLQYTDVYDNVTVSQIDDFLGERTEVGATDLEGNELYQYEGTFGIDFLNIKELKLIFDVSNYIDSLYVKFTSPLDYEVNYLYTINELEYYKTIMMDNIYGLYLIPKTSTMDNFSNINLNGKYNIEIRNNFDGSDNYDVLKKYENYIEPNFQYHYTFNNLNYLIYFENTKYDTEDDNSYYITFDTRYYNYAIKEFMFDEPTITNPNTNEDYVIKSDDDQFNVNDDKSFSQLISESFKSFIPCIKEIINLITIYFNGLPLILKCFYVFIFFITLAYIIIKFLI